MAVIAQPGQKQLKKAVVAAICGGVLAVGLATGITTWQLVGQRDAAPPTAGTTAAPDIATAMAATTPAAAASQRRQPAVYLVTSEEEATTLRMTLDAAAAIQDSLGLTPQHVDIIVVSSAEDEAQLTLAINEANVIAGGSGLPVTILVDLRPQIASAPVLGQDPAAFSDLQMYARWQAARVAQPDSAHTQPN